MATKGSLTNSVFASVPLQVPSYGPVIDSSTYKATEADTAFFRLPFINDEQRQKLDQAKKYAMDLSIKTVIKKQASLISEQQCSNVKRVQALVLLSRIYIGSINYDVREEHLRAAFSPFGAIRLLTLSYDPVSAKHKGFAFLEYEYPESAQMALVQMNAFPMGGRGIKVGRPTNMPSVTDMHEELLRECEKENRIFVSHIHENITEDDLKLVFEAFGKIVDCKLDYPASGNTKHRNFGFVEFENRQSAADAIHSMNLFDLGGQQLRVGVVLTPKSLMPNMSTMSAVSAAAAAAAQSGNATLTPASSLSNLGGPTNNETSIMTPEVSSSPQAINGNYSPSSGTSDSKDKGNSVIGVTEKSGESRHVPPPTIALPKLKSRPKAVAKKEEKPPEEKECPPKVAVVESSLFAEPQEEDMVEEEGQSMHIKGRDARTLMMQKLQRRREQKVMVLRNMVGPEDVDDLLESEVREECEKYGQVDSVLVYQERINPYEPEVMENLRVKIFVMFSLEDGALKGVAALNNRFFGGRTVTAELYDQETFEMGEFTR